MKEGPSSSRKSNSRRQSRSSDSNPAGGSESLAEDDLLGDGENQSFMETLRNEWSMFWDAIRSDVVDEEEAEREILEKGRLELISAEKLKEITRALSHDRKRLNQELEKLTREIEENSTKLESLKLVGGEQDETLKRLNELADQGQLVSVELSRLDDRLKQARVIESAIKKR